MIHILWIICFWIWLVNDAWPMDDQLVIISWRLWNPTKVHTRESWSEISPVDSRLLGLDETLLESSKPSTWNPSPGCRPVDGAKSTLPIALLIKQICLKSSSALLNRQGEDCCWTASRLSKHKSVQECTLGHCQADLSSGHFTPRLQRFKCSPQWSQNS